MSGGEITSNTLVGGNIRFTGNGLADELRLNNVDVTGGLVNIHNAVLDNGTLDVSQADGWAFTGTAQQ